MAEPLEQGIGSADPCPSGAGKEVAAWNAPRMGTLIFTHIMPMTVRSRERVNGPVLLGFTISTEGSGVLMSFV
ncbi:MAG TPA: hypothetical protein DEG88_06280 [Propionibacteriaceae bacterium]|nr:hypothetical protein [Propionibacteriaceae bacterium]